MNADGNNNQLLAALPHTEREQILAKMEIVSLPLGAVLHEPGDIQTRAFFPIDCIVSLLYELADGESAEVAIIGDDGMLGLPILMGDGRSPHRAMVQSAGTSLCMKARDLQSLFEACPVTRHMFLRYSQTLSFQIGQTAVCNRHHSVEQQLCRWLLMSIDRLPGDQLRMTQQLIADMLGVRRAGVTEAAGRLREDNIISYQRGQIDVLDRARLEAACCECYAVVKAEHARLLPPIN